MPRLWEKAPACRKQAPPLYILFSMKGKKKGVPSCFTNHPATPFKKRMAYGKRKSKCGLFRAGVNGKRSGTPGRVEKWFFAPGGRSLKSDPGSAGFVSEIPAGSTTFTAGFWLDQNWDLICLGLNPRCCDNAGVCLGPGEKRPNLYH